MIRALLALALLASPGLASEAPCRAMARPRVAMATSYQLSTWRLLQRHAGPDARALFRVAGIETGNTYHPNVVSPTGKYSGLFQFDARTWEASRKGAGLPANASPLDAECAVIAAVWLWRTPNGHRHWPCSKRLEER